jgi:tRNA A37 threonylcarbamoyladenosine modification protein TsaB
MIDARRGEVYCAVYRREGDELIEVAAPAVLQPGELFQTVGDGPLVFCGPGAEAHRTAIEQRSRWRLEPGSGDLARTLARMVTRAHREPLEPLYVRKTSAEIERSRRALTTEDP